MTKQFAQHVAGLIWFPAAVLGHILAAGGQRWQLSKLWHVLPYVLAASDLWLMAAARSELWGGPFTFAVVIGIVATLQVLGFRS